jgi:hypothetical protein
VTRNDLAPPTENPNETTLTLRLAELAAAVERLTAAPTAAELELKCFTPAEAGPLLGKTENWVVEAIRERRIPFTYVGRSPRLTADHIRQIRAEGEVKPSKYARPIAA